MSNNNSGLEEKVSVYISQNNLLEFDSTYIVALSGGADSVALLLLLKKLGYHIEAAHCNFHLRGKESDRDEIFVKDLCATNGIPFHLVHFETRDYASLHKISIEMAARELRYSYFEQLRKDIGARAICVAHHMNDSVETLLMNLIRGTGVHGLTGIHPINGYIIRPLLCVERKEIEQYLNERGQNFVTDSTNLIPDILRNKIRIELMPLLADINVNVVHNMQRTSKYVLDAVKIFDYSINSIISNILQVSDSYYIIDIKNLLKLPSPEYVLYEILRNYGFKSKQVEQIYFNLDVPPGRIFYSNTHNLVIDRGKIIIELKHNNDKTLKIPETGLYVFNENLKFDVQICKIDGMFKIPKSRNNICADFSKIKFPLIVRHVEAGDKFVPFGMNGAKLVSDYMTDCKKNILQKKNQLVVEDINGNILWLVGERIDNRYRITANSKTGLLLSLKT